MYGDTVKSLQHCVKRWHRLILISVSIFLNEQCDCDEIHEFFNVD